MMNRVWRVLLWMLLLVSTTSSSSSSSPTAEMTCEADGSCATSTSTSTSTSSEQQQQQQQQQQKQPFKVTVVNESTFRADIYWDDGRFGTHLSIVEPQGGRATLNANNEHVFFVTRHGVREGLFDVRTDEPYTFSFSHPGQVVTIPHDAAPSPNPCHDRYSICPTEAKRGSCETTPGWMIVHCCQSCDTYSSIDASRLIDPTMRCSKEHLNTTAPIWKAGDLNALFTKWATDAAMKELYDPTVLSSPGGAHGGIAGPWVMTLDHFVTPDEADALVRGGQRVGLERSTDQGATNRVGEREKVVSQTRTSSNAWCTGACEALPEVDAITQRIEDVTQIPRSHYESFQILEYQHDQFYRMHHDSSDGIDETPPGPRILTFFLYLSDVEEGGETYFNQLDLAVQPKKGRALVWPSVQDGAPDVWDKRMYHEAKEVIQGKKHAANHWIHLNDYITPNKWGCTGSFS
jgi:hypothetical protein